MNEEAIMARSKFTERGLATQIEKFEAAYRKLEEKNQIKKYRGNDGVLYTIEMPSREEIKQELLYLDSLLDEDDTTTRYKLGEMMAQEQFAGYTTQGMRFLRKEIEMGLKENFFGDEIALAELKELLNAHKTKAGTINVKWFESNIELVLGLYRAAGGAIGES